MVLADNQTYLVDYKGKTAQIVMTIPIVAQCVVNWIDGFLLVKDKTSVVFYYRFEDQRYNKKFEYEVADKENRVVALDTNEEKIIVLLESSALLGGKLKYEPTK